MIKIKIVGPIGAGKTSIGLALVRLLRDHKIPVSMLDEDDPQPVDVMSKIDRNLAAMGKRKEEVDIEIFCAKRLNAQNVPKTSPDVRALDVPDDLIVESDSGVFPCAHFYKGARTGRHKSDNSNIEEIDDE
jgi:Ni2+-binding GTPase involved in maturation of urease and hydrogenase